MVNAHRPATANGIFALKPDCVEQPAYDIPAASEIRQTSHSEYKTDSRKS